MHSYQLPIFSVRKIELGLLVMGLLWYASIGLMLGSANDQPNRLWPGWAVVSAFAPFLSAALAFALDRILKALNRPMQLREILLVVFVSPQFLGVLFIWWGLCHYAVFNL
jgi:hypothetical protein